MEGQLEAVDKAISEMEQLEDDFGKEQSKLTDCIRDTGDFKGDNYDRLISGTGESLIRQMKESKSKINKAADDLIDLRTKLQKEKNKQWGIFSGLADAWSSVKGWINKHANDF